MKKKWFLGALHETDPSGLEGSDEELSRTFTQSNLSEQRWTQPFLSGGTVSGDASLSSDLLPVLIAAAFSQRLAGRQPCLRFLSASESHEIRKPPSLNHKLSAS